MKERGIRCEDIIFGGERSTVCLLKGDMFIRNDNNNFSREWTRHAIKDGEGTGKRS